MIFNVLISVVAVLVGAVITWYLSRRYYKKAGADLVKEAAELRHLSTIMLNAMEDGGLVKLNRSETGQIVGRRIEATAVFEGSTTLTGDLEIKHIPKTR